MRFLKPTQELVTEPEKSQMRQLFDRASDAGLTDFIGDYQIILNSQLIDFAADEDNVLENWLSLQDPDGIWVK